MERSRERQVSKDMFNTGRRSAISTSELGLYSDHSDHYNTNIYGATVRKFVIVIMVIVTVILIGIFLYDFASSASVSSKVSQETKHIYILQNSLRKPSGTTRRPGVSLPQTIYIVNSSQSSVLEDRADDARNTEYKEASPSAESRSLKMAVDEPEPRTQNLQNFKLRDRMMLDREHNGEEPPRRQKQSNGNHAMIYRVRFKMPESDDGEEEEPVGDEDNQRATPFRFELKGPHPASFKRPKYPQLTQYRYPHSSRNIQDIIKYLTNDPDTLNRGIKFTGFYVNPKKYDVGHTDIGEVAMNSDRSEEQENPPYTIALNADPLYPYKPKHPSDVNLLATSNFRFSPMGLHRYNPYYDPFYQRPTTGKHASHSEMQYDNVGSYGTTNFGKKRKPKPFSVMLDIYPITDSADQTKKTSRLKAQATLDDGEVRRPFIPFFPRHSKQYGAQTLSSHVIAAQSQHTQAPEEDEKHQMILHLNLYPKRKSKMTRNDVIERSEMIPADEKEQLIDRLIVPFDAITKHLTDHAAVEEAKLDASEDLGYVSNSRYEETSLAKEDPEPIGSLDEIRAEKLVATTEVSGCSTDCEISTTAPETTTVTLMDTTTANTTTTTPEETTTLKNANSTTFKDIDTVEGFQKFADSLIATD